MGSFASGVADEEAQGAQPSNAKLKGCAAQNVFNLYAIRR
jgi:hypothetical protein